MKSKTFEMCDMIRRSVCSHEIIFVLFEKLLMMLYDLTKFRRDWMTFIWRERGVLVGTLVRVCLMIFISRYMGTTWYVLHLWAILGETGQLTLVMWDLGAAYMSIRTEYWLKSTYDEITKLYIFYINFICASLKHILPITRITHKCKIKFFLS